MSGVIPQLKVTVSDNNGHTSTTTYVNNNLTHVYEYGPVNFMVTETDQLGDVTTHYFYGEQEEERIISDIKQGVLSTTITCYNKKFSNCPSTILSLYYGIPVVTQSDVFTQLGPSGSWSLVEKTFDGYGNTTSESEWASGLTSPGTAPTVAATTSTTTTYNGLNGASCGTLANAYQYDRPCSVTTVGPSGQVAQTNYTYTLGHPTQTSKWVSGSTYLTSTAAYNSNGTVKSTTDALLLPTSYNYNGTGGCNNLLLTSTIFANGLSTSETWNCNGGVMATSTDVNRNVTTYSHADPLWRPTQVSYPDGGGTTTTYNTGTSLPWSVSTSTAITSSISLNNTTIYDGLGRVTQTQLTSDPTGVDYVDTTYDLLGRKATVSNPHRTAPSSTDGITTYSYDALDRVLSVIDPDSANDKITIVYSGNCTTVTDEVGSARYSCGDGLGRMTGVWEAPSSLNYETDYAYDALSNLLSVAQKGSNSANARTRSFQYDGLSRLTSATDPESGTTAYSYVTSGGSLCAGDPSAVCMKTAPSPNQSSTGTATAITTYKYEVLNRLSGKSYNDTYSGNGATPGVAFGYDGVALTGCTTAPPGLTDGNPLGLRTAMCDGSGGTSWSHDTMGRILQERRTIGTIKGDYENDAFNLDGSVASVTSLGYGVTYTYSGAARPLTALHSATNLVTGATYAPPGELTGMTLGSAITVANAYSDRLQPILLSAASPSGSVFSDCFDFHLGMAVTGQCNFSASVAGDNGNVYQIVNNRNNTRNQSFTYDTLNRITSAQSSGTQWGETFTIDAWGNLTNRAEIAGKSTYEPLSTSAGTNNQLSGFGYDPAGNMTSNGSASYAYDDENRLIATAGISYIYDGDGQRVEKCTEGSAPGTCASGATGTLYWRGSAGAPLTETDLSGNAKSEYIFFNGQRVARSDSAGAIHYYFSDHLGSHGVVENATGSVCEQDIDYYPYGGVENDYCSGTSVPQNYKFTGKERDAESGLDNSVFRYYGSSLGRFMTPDPAGIWLADPSNPQSWNRYAYVLNNPLSNIDPLGLDCAYDNGDGRFNVQPGDCNSLTDDGYYFDGTVDPSSLQYNVNGGLLGNVDGTTQCSGDCQTNSVNVTGQQGTLWQLLTTTVPYYDPNDVPLSPSGQAAALAIHNALANVPNVCSIGAQAEASATVFGVTASASASGSFSDNGAPGQLSAQLPFGQPHSIGSVQSQAQGTPLIPDAVPSPVNAQVQGGYVLSVNAGKTIGGNHLSLSLTAYANLGGRCP